MMFSDPSRWASREPDLINPIQLVLFLLKQSGGEIRVPESWMQMVAQTDVLRWRRDVTTGEYVFRVDEQAVVMVAPRPTEERDG